MIKTVGKWMLDGVGVLMVTPLKEDYRLNEDSVRKQIDWVIEKGAASLWPSGYIGEWPQLSLALRKRYFEVCTDQAKGRVWVAAGCHSTYLDGVVELINHAERVGCDLAWVCPVTPRKPTPDDLIRQYQYIIDRTSLPLGVYNSYPTGTYMRAEHMMNIASLSDRIVVMKDSVQDFAHIASIYHAGLGEKVSFFGTSQIMLPHLIWGAAGVLVSPFSAALAVSAYNAFKSKDMDKAWALQFRMTNERPLLALPATANMVPGANVTSSALGYHKAKTSMLLGIEMGPPAPPYAPATEAEIENIRKNLGEFKHLEV